MSDRERGLLDPAGLRRLYDFIRVNAERYARDVQLVLFTAQTDTELSHEEMMKAMGVLEQSACIVLHRNGVSARYSDCQMLTALPDEEAEAAERTCAQILDAYGRSGRAGNVSFTHDLITIGRDSVSSASRENRTMTILVVDDDKTNLVTAKNALKDTYKVVAATSGATALEYLRGNSCDLILLDILMPEMDGFETMKKIKEIPGCEEIPIIFLTANKDAETENQCLETGAVDYIQKPFAVKVLRSRAAKTLELFELRNGLRQKVREKTRRIEHLSNSIISALSHTIDAKDTYTSGHSQRVANYARMIAERMGKDREEQNEIYHAGLLHDIGKIRVSEDVINKPGRLTDEEFALIKLHPITGFHILREISDDRVFSEGARFHHERYDGNGYPNGLSGTQIPEIARIVGIADAYDAMTSNRSYRSALPQDVVRSEISRGKGSQFDPDIADIMLRIIDEDKDYKLREAAARQKKVLIADDEAANIETIEGILKNVDIYVVKSVSSGTEAVQALRGERFDIALLDVAMPEPDGYETAAMIRQFSDIPIVFMSADRVNFDIDNLREHNISDFITRPFKPAILLEILHAVLEL